MISSGKQSAMTSSPATPQPYQGHFDGHRHLFAQRVYFEDTDFSGVVYHARYLHFMERARSDMLARVGIEQRSAHEAGAGAYAVTAIDLKFKRPAHFDDALLLTSTVEAVRGASVDIQQTVSRDGETLVTAQVTAAFVAPGGRPARQPKHWIAAFQAIMTPQNSYDQGLT
jgi:acyl-CoA thioester hydrolase